MQCSRLEKLQGALCNFRLQGLQHIGGLLGSYIVNRFQPDASAGSKLFTATSKKISQAQELALYHIATKSVCDEDGVSFLSGSVDKARVQAKTLMAGVYALPTNVAWSLDSERIRTDAQQFSKAKRNQAKQNEANKKQCEASRFTEILCLGSRRVI